MLTYTYVVPFIMAARGVVPKSAPQIDLHLLSLALADRCYSYLSAEMESTNLQRQRSSYGYRC